MEISIIVVSNGKQLLCVERMTHFVKYYWGTDFDAAVKFESATEVATVMSLIFPDQQYVILQN